MEKAQEGYFKVPEPELEHEMHFLDCPTESGRMFAVTFHLASTSDQTEDVSYLNISLLYIFERLSKHMDPKSQVSNSKVLRATALI